jgi:hypothetical protein
MSEQDWLAQRFEEHRHRAPGTDLAAHEKFDTPPALLDPALRRR